MLAALSYSFEDPLDFDREPSGLSLEYNMFRNRANSQKPGDELYENFKKTYPEVRASSSSVSPPQILGSSSAGDDLAQHYVPTSKPSYNMSDPHQFMGSHEQMSHLESLNLFSPLRTDEHGKDFDRTPRPLGEGWRFTPSILDSNAMNFASFNAQMPSYHASTPGAMNTIYHHQAGDLHTPKLSYGLGTPLSMPTSEGGVQTIPAVEATELPQTLHAHEFHNFHAFAPQRPFETEGFEPQQSFEPLNHGLHTALQPQAMEAEMNDSSAIMGFRNADQTQVVPSPPTLTNPFKYHVTLNAPTAMIKQADEIPVTYLNKGQAYQISILNTEPPAEPNQRYRTFIRISFQDELQRERPATCWQLWKEGRGSNEAHQRGGKLQAVEYVEPVPSGEDDSMQPKIELEVASFDGFAVTWTPPPHGRPECTLSVRFNFLSTDFSHSKGVKGIPVRLCAKTEQLGHGSPRSQQSKAEICYCRVKLFRDHGAERKLSNDVAHVKKTIDKLHQQISQIDAGMRDFGKKKRPSFGSKPPSVSKPGKAKHKRTWSMSSTSSAGGGSAQRSVEEDLHLRLATMKDMFSSTRPVSVLALPGDPGDDPDLFPVHLNMDQVTAKAEPREGWDKRNNSMVGIQQTRASSVTSRSPSSASLQSHSAHGSMMHLARHYSGQEQPEDWPMYQEPSSSMPDLTMAQPKRVTPPLKVQRRGPDQTGQLSGWIEAIDIDPSYQPPPEPVVKPIASFYIQPTIHGVPPPNNYYRAIYLYQRTSKDLVRAIANKCNVEPTSIIRTLHLKTPSVQVIVDDDVVQTMPEGQDMKVELNEIREDGPVRREWDLSEPEPLVDGEVDAPINTVHSKGWEMKLIY